jgi:hypothetical protein
LEEEMKYSIDCFTILSELEFKLVEVPEYTVLHNDNLNFELSKDLSHVLLVSPYHREQIVFDDYKKSFEKTTFIEDKIYCLRYDKEKKEFEINYDCFSNIDDCLI